MAGKKFDITKFAATLPEAVPESGTREQIEYIDEAKLSGDGENFYSMEGIEALAQNIELVGLQQPLRVRPDPDDEGGYIVVSGHRRLTAIRTICKVDEPERWRTVPCIVERGELSPAMRELRLIYANSDTRRMSNADLSAQAERVEKLLYQLQEEGVEFPGRMRDHVAEVCQISPTKVGNLQVIKKGLKVPGIIARWEAGELPEAAALEIARMDIDTQYRFLDWMIDNGGPWTIKNVQEFVRSRTAAAPAERPATKLPTLFSVDLCAPEWLPLDAEHWPTEGALVVLSYKTGLGGSSYLVARCAGGADEAYPFISTDAGTTVDDIVECRCDRWMPLAECRRGGEGA